MTKEEFIKQWIDPVYEEKSYAEHLECLNGLDSLIQQAIIDHEAKQWNTDMSQAPKDGSLILITEKDPDDKEGEIYLCWWGLINRFYKKKGWCTGSEQDEQGGFDVILYPIAWAYLPKPYKEGGDQ